MGWYPCADCCGAECFGCNSGTTPNTITVTLNGITDAGCDHCSEFNATFVLQQRVLSDVCEWYYEFYITNQDCYGFVITNKWILQANVYFIGGKYYWAFGITKDGDTSVDVDYWSSGSTSKLDCSQSVTLPRTSINHGYCNWPANVTLIPA